MSPATRTTGARKRAAKKRPPAKGKRAGSQSSPRPKVPCPECGQPCAKGSGLASHMRSKHPDPPVEADPVHEATATDPPAERVVPTTPEGMSEGARGLWSAIVNVYDLRPDELRVLEDACREAQVIDRLQRDLDDGAPLIVKGSMGQQVASPLLTEVRQHRATLARLLAALKLPDDEVTADGMAARSVQARAAANARWRRGV